MEIADTADTMLTRSQAAAVLTMNGFPTATSTLATMATRGGGPAYRLFGNRTLYRRADLLEWAASRLSAPRVNTSQAA